MGLTLFIEAELTSLQHDKLFAGMRVTWPFHLKCLSESMLPTEASIMTVEKIELRQCLTEGVFKDFYSSHNFIGGHV
jgi:hypothetical protein